MITLLLALFFADATQAERDYRAGNFREALAQFQAALADPALPEGPLLYDMGNCAYRLGRHAEALLAYRRAALRMPRDPELRFNLRLTEEQLGFDDPGAESFGAAITSTLDWLTRGELLVLAATLETLGLVGLVLLRRRGSSAARTAMALLLGLGLLAAGRLVQLQWFAGPPTGVVLERPIDLRAEPRPELPPLLTLTPGESVQVEQLGDRWLKITHPHGQGWTERAGVGLVE